MSDDVVSEGRIGKGVAERQRLGRYAEVVERILDEVARAVGENDDRPRVALRAFRAWAEPQRTSSALKQSMLDAVEVAVAWEEQNFFEPLRRGEEVDRMDPWVSLWCAVACFKMIEWCRGPARWSFVHGCVHSCASALVRIGYPNEAARERMVGEFTRAGWK